jgi:hypothetical protein
MSLFGGSNERLERLSARRMSVRCIDADVAPSSVFDWWRRGQDVSVTEAPGSWSVSRPEFLSVGILLLEVVLSLLGKRQDRVCRCGIIHEIAGIGG